MTEKLHIFPGPAHLRLFMRKAKVVERVFDGIPVPDRSLDEQVYPWDEAAYKVGPDAKGRFWLLEIDGQYCEVSPYTSVEPEGNWTDEFELEWVFRQEIAARFESAPWVKFDAPAEWMQ